MAAHLPGLARLESTVEDAPRRPHSPGGDPHFVEVFGVRTGASTRFAALHPGEVESQDLAGGLGHAVVRDDANRSGAGFRAARGPGCLGRVGGDSGCCVSRCLGGRGRRLRRFVRAFGQDVPVVAPPALGLLRRATCLRLAHEQLGRGRQPALLQLLGHRLHCRANRLDAPRQLGTRNPAQASIAVEDLGQGGEGRLVAALQLDFELLEGVEYAAVADDLHFVEAELNESGASPERPDPSQTGG